MKTLEEIQELTDNINASMNRMMEMMDSMTEKIDNILDNISSEKLNNDAVASMNKKWDTTGPR